MDSQTLFHKPSRNPAAVIYHRVFFHFKVMLFGTALFCVLLCVAVCTSSMEDLRTSGNYAACGSFYSNHDSGFQDAFASADNLEITSGKSSPQLSIGKVCAISNLFCFPSTLPGYISEDRSFDRSVIETSRGFIDDIFAVGSVHSRNNLSWSQNYGGEVYKLRSGRVVSCSLNFEDSIGDISFCQRSSSAQILNSEKIKTPTLDNLSVPHVEVGPSLLDYGQTYLYSPSISFISVGNTHSDTSLSVYEHYSTDSQFYPCNLVGLSLRNHGPFLLTVVSISKIGEGVEVLQIKFMEGLMLFANSVTPVATITFTPTKTRRHECRLVVSTNDSSNPQIEIPCDDILDAARIVSASEIKTEADELILGNWRSHATVTGGASVLDNREILFPMVEIGTHRSKWIAVKNPGQQPVVMQLVLNSGEIVDECRNLLEHSSSSSIVQKQHTTPLKYGFSIGDRSVTEAYVHPNSRALLGPVIFHPSSRCAWKSSALIRNNLTGVEWVPLRGFGGSISLALFEGIKPLQNIEFLSENSSSGLCSQTLSRELYAKNVGDLQLEVNRLQVSGTECGLDGFVVENCKGFVLEPDESTKIEISFRNDYSSAVVQRDLELALLTGFLVIPMKASIPTSMLTTCRKSIAWIKVKKSSVVILLVGSVVYLVFCYVIPQAASRDSTSFSSKVNGFINPVEENETLIIEKVSLVENNCIQSSSVPPANLTIKIGKEKRRRHRKKKGTQLEVSSSQSGNSTPSSPLDSPTKFVATPKTNFQESPTVGQDSPNPFVHTEKNLASKPKSEPKVSMKYVEQKAAVSKTIFPCKNRPSPSTYLTLKSTVAPHLRAPGPKLNYVKNEGGWQKDEYSYDIWGEHIFGFRSKEVFAKSPLAIQSNYDSFFARGPQNIVSISKLKSVSQQEDG